MFSIPQIRSLQGAIAAYGTVTAANRAGVYQTLGDALRVSGFTLDATRLVPVLGHGTDKMRGLIFRYREDKPSSARLVLAENREAPSALHLALPEKEHRATLVGLHYVHATRRHATAAYYMLAGALAVSDDSDFEYSRVKRKTASIEQLSDLIYTLNTSVADLPYPKGRKLAVVDALKKMDVNYVGELIRKDAETLKAALGPHWITIQSILRNLKLLPGSPIPQWRAPR